MEFDIHTKLFALGSDGAWKSGRGFYADKGTCTFIANDRYTSNGETKTWFLGIVELSDGRAVTITDALLQLCGKMEFDIHTKLFALGSDGASVMLGCRGGVSMLMMERVPYLTANHCVAHRLALACGQAADEIAHLKNS